jgi:hypothetical protein
MLSFTHPVFYTRWTYLPVGDAVSSPAGDLAETFLTLFIPSEMLSTAYHAQY